MTVTDSTAIMHQCPACGYTNLPTPPRAVDGSASGETCPCCNIHFGRDDEGDTRVEIYRQWRLRWIMDGMRWSSSTIEAPVGWEPRAQVRSIESG